MMKQKNKGHYEVYTDLLWSEIKAIIPEKIGKVGRPESDNRRALNGIVFILKTGCQWRYTRKIRATNNCAWQIYELVSIRNI